METPPSIISRIRKLSAMTTAAGCTEAEASVAAIKLHALLLEHNLSEASLNHTYTTSDYITSGWSYIGPSHWTVVCRSLEDLFSVKFWTDGRAHEDIDGISLETVEMRCFGLPANVTAALAMAQVCYLAIADASEAWLKTKPAKSQLNLPAFQTGVAMRLCDRIRELITAPVPGTALTVHSKATVWSVHASIYGYTSYAKKRPMDPASLAAGKFAGSRIALGVHHAIPQTARIGHTKPPG